MPNTSLLERSPRGWVTDGGLETDLIFHHGVELPEFAAYPLLGSERGRRLLRDYFLAYAAIARAAAAGLLLEAPPGAPTPTGAGAWATAPWRCGGPTTTPSAC